MIITKERLYNIIREELAEVLEEKCITTQVDKQIVHRGSGNQKRSYIQVKTTSLCDDNITSPTERAAREAETERKNKEIKKKQEQRAKEWRREKEKAKQKAIRPDKSG